MSDGPALYRAVIENPREDTPRLALADWLDEQPPRWVKCTECGGSGEFQTGGTPSPSWRECDKCDPDGEVIDDEPYIRAEFIRLQIKLANWQPYVPPLEIQEIANSDRLYAPMAKAQIEEEAKKRHDEHEIAQRRAEAILDRYREKWARPLSELGWQANSTWVPDCEFEFHRGFASRFITSIQTFMENAGAIFGQHPIEEFAIGCRAMIALPTTFAWRRAEPGDAPYVDSHVIPVEIFERLPLDGDLNRPGRVWWESASIAWAADVFRSACWDYALEMGRKWREHNPLFIP